MPSDVLTVREAAQRTRWSEWSIYEAIRHGDLPALRLRKGGRLRILASDLEAAARRNGQPAPTPAA